ncbi:MAG: hypothetical protein K6T94_05415 [Paenibacillus sp.]|nr:hypothetical protein [Paenibacillus sp.]
MQAIGSKLETYINKYLDLWSLYGVIQVTQKGKVLFKNSYGIKNDMNSRFSMEEITLG